MSKAGSGGVISGSRDERNVEQRGEARESGISSEARALRRPGDSLNGESGSGMTTMAWWKKRADQWPENALRGKKRTSEARRATGDPGGVFGHPCFPFLKSPRSVRESLAFSLPIIIAFLNWECFRPNSNSSVGSCRTNAQITAAFFDCRSSFPRSSAASFAARHVRREQPLSFADSGPALDIGVVQGPESAYYYADIPGRARAGYRGGREPPRRWTDSSKPHLR